MKVAAEKDKRCSKTNKDRWWKDPTA